MKAPAIIYTHTQTQFLFLFWSYSGQQKGASVEDNYSRFLQAVCPSNTVKGMKETQNTDATYGNQSMDFIFS